MDYFNSYFDRGILFRNISYQKNKEYELEIYQLEVENLKNKKEVAEIRGEVLQDHIENREITEPAKEVTMVFPTIFYSVLLVFVIIVRIMWL